MDADRAARFEALASEVLEPVRRFLARRSDADSADDALADTLLVCWRRLEEVPEPALPWVYGVARHCLANLERAARRQRRVQGKVATLDPPREIQPGPLDGAEDDLAWAVRQAWEELRSDDAEVLRLWAWEQLEAAEIAQVLEVSANAASVRLHRAKGRLREILEQGGKNDGAGGHERVRGREQ
ncbi:RNA polymerase sigma factor [Nocardioides acrostichi]|uniref:Sigma-70 family RNA polymerase sigma factor n=1 Tax=Nocardioides acrostichi TaxID=2784339 RepID=A0A930V012_9ACTN|nr:sigma-70 family RNA polymerase sigma factor [Nocardioides acrostichi]MBF4161534.1 sigma-70 family RNA polymerase sigma factor [Nocardioides acrostichi]